MCNQGTWEGLNGDDDLVMKVPCRLLFFCGGEIYQSLKRKALYAIVKLFSKIYAQK